MLLEIFAQAASTVSTDQAAGIAGWTGTGLLGSVLAWLMFKHLPAKDQQVKELIQTHLQELRDKDKAFVAELRDQRVEFRASLEKVVAHCEEEMQAVTNRLTELIRPKA